MTSNINLRKPILSATENSIYRFRASRWAIFVLCVRLAVIFFVAAVNHICLVGWLVGWLVMLHCFGQINRLSEAKKIFFFLL